MAIFMDTGGGDIYAGETKEACIAAMKKDMGYAFFAQIESNVREVSGSRLMCCENEDGSIGESSTLDAEYTNLGYGYCIASSN